MNPPGVIVTSLGTLVVGVPMVKTMRMSDLKKTEIKEKLPSVREATLAAVKKSTKEEVQTDSSTNTTTAKAEKSNMVPKKKPTTTTTTTTTTTNNNNNNNNTTTNTIPVTAANNTPTRVSSSPSSSIKKESKASTRGVPKSTEKSVNKNHPVDAVFTWIRSHPFAAAGAVVAATFTLFKLVGLYRKHMIKKEIMMADDSETLHLYVAPPSFTFPKVARSSIVLKTFLQLASIPYKEYILTDPSYSPIGHLPFIRYKGRCEGSVIVAIEYLTSEFDVKMDHCVTDKEKAIGDAVVAMLEYSKGIMQDHSIYMNCNNNNNTNNINNTKGKGLYAKVLQTVKRPLTAVLDWISTTMGKWTTMDEAGLREEKDRELQILREFQAVEHIIGKKSFLLSALPTTYDCAVYAVLQPIFAADDISRFTESLMYVRHSDVLSRYVNRVSRAVFPDLHRQSSLSTSRSNGSRETSLVY